ncbi:helix-turn-helix domain-containing protein [Nonomuraea sp. CA-218870]|uniref:helix-turn-helix domain-containing protein n=1 Tax=Nonomuraea sp. CA-218870 TaxID=3239998 RepID=UPI003D92B32E
MASMDRRQVNEVGPSGAHVAANLRRLRGVRGLSTSQLSKLLSDHGRPIQQSGITRMEKGDRKIDVDDLVALAVVLGVNPNALLLPPVADQTSTEVTVAGEVSSWRAWRWADGQEPLKHPYDDDDFADFQMHARPKGKRRYQMLGERSNEELVKRREGVEEIGRRLYPDDPQAQAAHVESERRRDPEPWREA